MKINGNLYMKKKAIYFVLVLASFASFLTSCATIVHGTHQKVGISSTPSNANVWVDRHYVGATPMIVDMSRGDNHTVTIALDGFMPYEMTFTKQFSGWVFGNLLFGGVIGVAIDAISGGIYKLTPEQVQAEMCCSHIAYKKSNDSHIMIVLEPKSTWEKIGNLIAAN